MFGLAGVKTDKPRSASIVAVTDCVFAVLEQSDYYALCKLGVWSQERHEAAQKQRQQDMRHWPLFRDVPSGKGGTADTHAAHTPH
jgi:hypothetical protein